MRLLVAGLGSIGQRHVRNLRSLAPVEIVAYRRRRLPLPADLQGDWIRELDDLDEALAQHPDAALVCGPPAVQAEIARKVVEADCPLFIEKPIADRLDGLDALVGEAERRDLTTLVGYNLRFLPQLPRLRAMVEEGRIGRVVSIRTEVGKWLPDWHPWEDYRQGYSARKDLSGGAILDLIHEIDYTHLLGGPVSRVTCVAKHASSLEISTEDVAEIVLEFASGALGSVHVDYVQRTTERSCRVIGEEGTLVWRLLSNELHLFEATSGQWQVFREADFPFDATFALEMRHFLACLEGKEEPVVDLRTGVEDLRIALAAHESARAGRGVELSRASAGSPAGATRP